MKVAQLLFIILFVSPFLVVGQQNAKDKGIPDYSMTDRKDIPVELTWRLDDLYKNIDEWKADKADLVKMIDKIDETAKGWTSSAPKMLAMLELSDKIGVKATRVYSYVSFLCTADMGNTNNQAMKGELQSIFVQLGTKFSFFSPDILALGAQKFSEYLKAEPKLAPYKFSIESTLRSKAHVLPSDQQKIVTMTGMFSNVPDEASQILNDLEIPSVEVTLSDGKKVTLNQANYQKYRGTSNAADRTLVMTSFWANQKKFENTHSVLIAGAMKQHLFSAKTRNYSDCLAARLFGDSINPEVYHTLIKMVHNNLSPLHRYINLKKKLLKLEKFRYEDLYASSVPSADKDYTFQEAEKIVLESMQPLGNDYINALKLAFNNRWMDIYPNKGKESGAYSSGVYGVHPYIKLNYNGKYDAVSTLTHELGHSMHSYFSDKTQHYTNTSYPTFLAEIASTFNENMLMDYLLKNEKDDLFKLYILDSYLDQLRGTLYRQTLFAEFELAMHQQAEKGESLTAEWLNATYLKIVRDFYGHDKGICEVGDYIQTEWSRIPHFYMNFYVFQYSTGIIASLALTDKALHGTAKDKELYLNMLKSGGSNYPITLLKNAGVDMTSKEPYDAAFKQFDHLISEMEIIVERLKKQGKL